MTVRHERLPMEPRTIRLILLTSLVLACALAGASSAQDPARGGRPDTRARARLVAEQTPLIPGQQAFIGLAFDIDPGWHLYWNGASDSGMPITFEFETPAGVTVGPALWPAPKRQVLPGEILDYVYEKRVTLLFPVTLTDSAGVAPGGKVTIKAALSWMVCKSVCLVEEADVSITLTAGAAGAATAPTADAARFAEARKTIPRPAGEAQKAFTSTWEGRKLHIRAPGATEMVFYVGAESAPLARPIRDGAAKGDTLDLEFEDSAKPAAEGVLEIRGAAGTASQFYCLKSAVGGEKPTSTNANPKG